MQLTATLIDWRIDTVTYGLPVIIGTIAGDDSKGRFASGDVVRTSPLKRIDFETGIAETRNSVYKLA